MKEWEYRPSPSLSQTFAESLTVFPRERDMTQSLIRIFWNLCLRLFLKVYFRLEIIGRERLPQGQSFVLAANHTSHLDAVCLLSAFPVRNIDRTFSVAAKDSFFSSFFRSFFAAVFVNALPFDRQGHHRQSLELCADALSVSDQALIMFPEGTRSLSGEVQSFKPGIGALVAGTDRWVVPAYISGAFIAWPKGDKVPRPFKVKVFIGSPLRFTDVAANKEGFELVARKVEMAVRKLNPKETPDV